MAACVHGVAQAWPSRVSRPTRIACACLWRGSTRRRGPDQLSGGRFGPLAPLACAATGRASMHASMMLPALPPPLSCCAHTHARKPPSAPSLLASAATAFAALPLPRPLRAASLPPSQSPFSGHGDWPAGRALPILSEPESVGRPHWPSVEDSEAENCLPSYEEETKLAPRAPLGGRMAQRPFWRRSAVTSA